MRTVGLLLVAGVFFAACSGDDDDTGVPAAPSALNAALMTGQPHLTWTDNANDETGFSIERMIQGTGAFAEVATETFDIEQYHDTSAASGKTYVYRVIAENASGASAPSNEATITTP